QIDVLHIMYTAVNVSYSCSLISGVSLGLAVLGSYYLAIMASCLCRLAYRASIFPHNDCCVLVGVWHLLAKFLRDTKGASMDELAFRNVLKPIHRKRL